MCFVISRWHCAIPRATTSNDSGYSAKSIVSVEDPDGISHNVVIDEDDCYRYYAEKLLSFNFMITMINKDMLHILQVPIKEKNPIKLYQMILNYFKANKQNSRKLLAQHRLSNGDIVRDLSHSLISNLAQAQGSDLPEMQQFGILRDLMKNDHRPVVIQTFHYACLQKLSLDEAVASLIEICNNIPIEGLKMAAAITFTERYL